jgi:hypothetical protein
MHKGRKKKMRGEGKSIQRGKRKKKKAEERKKHAERKNRKRKLVKAISI